MGQDDGLQWGEAMTAILDLLLPVSSWLIVLAAFGLAVQNFRYLRRNCSRRQNLHFGFALLAFYLGGLYLTAAIEPTIWFIRSGLATKLGLAILFWMMYTVTRMDEEDYRLNDRIGRDNER